MSFNILLRKGQPKNKGIPSGFEFALFFQLINHVSFVGECNELPGMEQKEKADREGM